MISLDKIRSIGTAAMLAAALAGCSTVSDEVTREFVVGHDFEAYPQEPFTVRRDGFEIRYKVIAVNGLLELCGAMLVADPDRHGPYLRMLRRATLLVDGKPALRDLSYFNTRARSFAPFTTDLAPCRAIGMPVPAEAITTELKLNERLYRFRD